ncbi:MAG: ANTAR domain-containing protein [Eubacteriales bacterium]|nr:ANTAR domain-containing protein [Eubacteriales bacterium]
MVNVIVAFSRPEDAKNIKKILVKSGFDVTSACTSGAQALAQAEDLGSGVIVCGGRLPDMMYSELHDCMPEGFSMLLIASPDRLSARPQENLVCLPTPLKVHSLVESMEMMAQAHARRRKRMRQQPRERSQEELKLMKEAKELLMERNGMTEEEAHRYMQKCSMDSGTNMTETAQMIISLNSV